MNRPRLDRQGYFFFSVGLMAAAARSLPLLACLVLLGSTCPCLPRGEAWSRVGPNRNAGTAVARAGVLSCPVSLAAARRDWPARERPPLS